MRSLLLVPVIIALAAPPVSAQRLPAPFASVRDQRSQIGQARPDTTPSRNPGGAIIGGVVGAAAGLFAGIMAGDMLGGRGKAYGGLIGEATGVALGAFLGDNLRGNLATDLVASAGGAALGWLIADSADDPALLFPAAALQTAVVVGIELGVAWKKSARQ